MKMSLAIGAVIVAAISIGAFGAQARAQDAPAGDAANGKHLEPGTKPFLTRNE